MSKKTKKCVLCNTQHSNKSKPDFKALASFCFRCNFLVETLESCVKAINNFIPTGDSRPRRKLTIEKFKIEKI